MFPTALLTAFLLLVVSVAANPIVVRKPSVSLSFARHLNITGSRDLVAKGSSSGVLSRDGVVSVGVTNVGVAYHATVGVGSPPPTVSDTLLIDTGSSNTWVGAGKTYVRTNTSVQTSDSTEFTDTVTIGPGLVISGQSIGVASDSTGFTGFDGVLGIGPTDRTVGTLSPDTGSSVPTVTDNLFSSGIIESNLVSVNGELTFGGTDSEKYTGDITFIPITSTSPANQFWGIDGSIRYGASTSILSTTAGIVDTATALFLITTDAFNRYSTATGAVLDVTTGLLSITSAQFANLESLFFTTGGTTFELTANAQIWPRALNTLIGGTSGKIYLIVNDIGTSSGEGLDFINGCTFLERFYSVYDTGNNRVGLATTPFTTATTN
ncbi:aspartic peptidase A1 [Multifurca ochricompacta]|uniref:Aspartic peptidase A1 n=1 Tax=Multifurca ochricompacta TaxID=376703 RepID=A0AAD4LZJ9_9AGAM|nr:aspartic peptidase A1 [Multifurca ochricompacta]